MEEILRNVPRSYDDFVRYAIERMEENESVKTAVLEHIRIHPESNSSDILQIIMGSLGLGAPLEIVEDEAVRKPIRVAML